MLDAGQLEPTRIEECATEDVGIDGHPRRRDELRSKAVVELVRQVDDVGIAVGGVADVEVRAELSARGRRNRRKGRSCCSGTEKIVRIAGGKPQVEAGRESASGGIDETIL